MGSKSRHAKCLLPIILENRKEWYLEPFVGGCNVIDKVDGARIGVDNNKYLISMWKALQKGWIPPESVTFEEYCSIKENKQNYKEELVGYVGFNLSFAGKWWGGYARDKAGKRNYGLEAYNNVMKQVENIKDVIFYCMDFNEFQHVRLTKPTTIYCDPPYANTTGYHSSFDHQIFWEWCRNKVNEGHDVFVSEYSAPEDFVAIWEKEVNNTLVQDTGSKQGVEKLFIYRG